SAPPTIVFDAPTVRRLAIRLAAEPGVSLPSTPDGDPADEPERAAGPNALQRAPDEGDIAVIGLACRFAKAPTPEDLWRLLLSGGNAMEVVTGARFFGETGADATTGATTGATAVAPLDAPYDFDP